MNLLKSILKLFLICENVVFVLWYLIGVVREGWIGRCVVGVGVILLILRSFGLICE